LLNSAVSSPYRPLARRFTGADFTRDLERRVRLSESDAERATLADSLVPEYVTRGDSDSAARLLSSLGDVAEPALRARLLALAAVVKAMRHEEPRAEIAEAVALLELVPEPTAAVVRQRAGVAMFFAQAALEAEEHSLRALWLCEKNGLHRLAARAASVLYGVHYHLTGDLQAAAYYAEVGSTESAAGGELASRQFFLIAQFDLATVFADWDRASSLRHLVRREGGGDTAGSTTAAHVADALLHGSRSDFAAMRGCVDALIFPGANPLDLSFALALRALASAGLGLDSDARGEARRALGLSSTERARGELAYHTLRKRVGGILAAYTSTLIGDAYHGMRALDVRAKRPGAVGTLAELLGRDARGLPVDMTDPNVGPVRGYLAVALRAHEARQKREASIPEPLRSLTATELQVLRSVALGRSNSEIARERSVSRNAVERRLMSAYEKLGVRTRGEAVARISKSL
jgi:DNA-binding CsgD family transcriptional regulator